MNTGIAHHRWRRVEPRLRFSTVSTDIQVRLSKKHKRWHDPGYPLLPYGQSKVGKGGKPPSEHAT